MGERHRLERSPGIVFDVEAARDEIAAAAVENAVDERGGLAGAGREQERGDECTNQRDDAVHGTSLGMLLPLGGC